MLTVEKIGGTSMSQFEDVLKNIMIRDGKQLTNRIFVVSAYGGVTNMLLENKKTKAPGIYAKFAEGGEYEEALDDLLEELLTMNKKFEAIGLDLSVANDYITNRIQQTKNILYNMAEVIASGYVIKKDILLASRELLSSIGEAHSAFNSVNILKNNNVPAVFVDLSGFHDSKFMTIDERIHHELQNIDFSKCLTVATGYTKGTEGIMREFDRGYSDVTFAKIAVEVNADEAVIHKEYHLSSADPNLVGVEKAVPVGYTNYDVADQLADIGMEAIHPKASKPVEIAGIDLRIKNTFEPDHPGTLISKDYRGIQSGVEIIAGSKQMTIIEVHDSSMVGEVGFDLHVMKIFQKYSISYTTKSTNANSISMVIWDRPENQALINELDSHYQLVTAKEVAIICVMGSNIAQPGVLAKAAQILHQNDINIECVAQSLRQVNMQFVINRKDYEKAVIALNDALCFKQQD